MVDKKIKLETNPSEFFREQLHEALSNQQVSCSDEVEYYLVNLLCEFVSPTKLQTSVGEIDVFDTPLAFIIKSALEAPPAEQVKIYKVLGDTSLYLSGYFQDYCLRKSIDMGYYRTIGSTAYRNVSSLLRYGKSGSSQREVFEELSDKFAQVVDVVADVADLSGAINASGVLALYERWSQTPTERLHKLLVRNGVIPLAGKDKNVQ